MVNIPYGQKALHSCTVEWKQWWILDILAQAMRLLLMSFMEGIFSAQGILQVFGSIEKAEEAKISMNHFSSF